MADVAYEQPPKEDNLNSVQASNKRKRPSHDAPTARPGPGFQASNLSELGYDESEGMHLTEADLNLLAQHNAGNDAAQQQQHQNGSNNVIRDASDTAAAALTAYNGLTVPQPTEMQFQHQPTQGTEHQFQDMGDGSQFSLGTLKESPIQGGGSGSPSQGTPQHKPTVGSDEWHKVRRDNHKEVERRRRETINEGINELAKIVPGCEKNKGSILQRAVQFITQLKENEAQNIEKWTLEKLLTEQAISELSASCDKFKSECQRAWEECAIWKQACEANGIVPEGIRERENNEGNEES